MAETQSTPAPSPDTGRWSDVFKGRLGIYALVLNMGTILFGTSNFVVIAIMPTIASDIGGLRYYAWTFALFSVGSMVGAAGTGPMRQAFGHRLTYVGGGILFVAGLVGAGLAPNMELVVFWRLVQGVGGGAINSQAYALIAQMFPENLRGRALGLISTAWGVATLMGPAFGGFFAEFGNWRGAFWTLAGFGVVFTLLAWCYVPASESKGGLADFPVTRLALLGGSVLGLSLTSQIDDNLIRLLLVIGSVAGAAIAFRRDARAEHSLFPRKVLVLNSELGAAFWIIMLGSMTMVGSNLFVTLYLQVLHGVTPLVASLIYAIYSITWSTVAVLVASWTGRLESSAIAGGLVIMMSGLMGIAFIVATGPVVAIACLLGLVGVGMGFINNPVIQRAIAAAPPAERAGTGSSVAAIRTLGYSFGAALGGLVAAVAGLTNDAAPEILAPAMEWVYLVGTAFPMIGLLVAIPLLVHGHRRMTGDG
ncbi:MAG: MFS transporter [Rhodospirillales bacterium]|nr:MFS transporter [Rhodospirillales bacterium]